MNVAENVPENQQIPLFKLQVMLFSNNNRENKEGFKGRISINMQGRIVIIARLKTFCKTLFLEEVWGVVAKVYFKGSHHQTERDSWFPKKELGQNMN